jgi:flavodoxin
VDRNFPNITRRTLLQHTVATASATAAAALLSACTTTEPRGEPVGSAEPDDTATMAPSPTAVPGRVLIAYFSRAGENYYYGDRIDLEVGNTEVLANTLSGLIDCDVYRIEAADPYPESYDETRDRNVREQDENARPAIANTLASLDQYQTVLLGSPIWNVRPPMIMSTFAESFDFTGKLIHPFVTYAVSGLGSTEETYAELLSTANFGEALAIQGETVAESDADAEAWLRRIGLLA